MHPRCFSDAWSPPNMQVFLAGRSSAKPGGHIHFPRRSLASSPVLASTRAPSARLFSHPHLSFPLRFFSYSSILLLYSLSPCLSLSLSLSLSLLLFVNLVDVFFFLHFSPFRSVLPSCIFRSLPLSSCIYLPIQVEKYVLEEPVDPGSAHL